MAEKKSKDATTVRRYKASDDNAPTKSQSRVKKAVAKTRDDKKAAKKKAARGEKRVGYFKGAWQELREVRWPNRKATWQLTLAVILFSVVFTIFVTALDLVFDYLSKKVLL